MASLDGWDLVFAANVNALTMGAPVRLDPPIEVHLETDGAALDAVIAGMRVIPGGSGRSVLVSLAVQKGNAHLGTLADIDLAGATMTASLNLQIEQASDAGRLRATRSSNANDNSVIALSDLRVPGAGHDEIGMILELLTEGIAQGAPVAWAQELASITPDFGMGGMLDLATAQPLFVDGAGSVPGRLCILGVIKGNSVSGLAVNLPAAAQFPDSDMSVALSIDAFQRHILIPAIAQRLNISAGDLSLSGGVITGNPDFALREISVADLSFTPKIKGISVMLDKGAIDVVAKGRCALELNAAMDFTARASFKPLIDADSGAITFAMQGSVDLDHSLDVPWWEEALAIGIDPITAALAAALADYLSGRVADQSQLDIGNALQPSALATVVDWQMSGTLTYTACSLAEVFAIQAKLKE